MVKGSRPPGPSSLSGYLETNLSDDIEPVAFADFDNDEISFGSNDSLEERLGLKISGEHQNWATFNPDPDSNARLILVS